VLSEAADPDAGLGVARGCHAEGGRS
jgi:hypothetical protein